MYGKLVIGTKVIKDALVENEDERLTYRDKLEYCLLELCKQLEIQIPLWLDKNTREFVRFRKTFFPSEQFTEKVYFDRFDIKVEQ